MHKIPNAQEAKQLELQKQSFIANTRFRLAETFLNTLLSRPDVDLTEKETKPTLIQMSLEYADDLMVTFGMVVKMPVE